MILNTNSLKDLKTYVAHTRTVKDELVNKAFFTACKKGLFNLLGVIFSPTIIAPIMAYRANRKKEQEFQDYSRRVIASGAEYHKTKFILLRNMKIEKIDLHEAIKAEDKFYKLYHSDPSLIGSNHINTPNPHGRVLMSANAQHLIQVYFMLHDAQKVKDVLAFTKQFSEQHRHEMDSAFEFHNKVTRDRLVAELDAGLQAHMGVSFTGTNPEFVPVEAAKSMAASNDTVEKVAPEASEKTPLLVDQAPPAYAEIYPSLDSVNYTAVLPYNPAMS